MKPLTSNILYLIIAGILIIGVGSVTYSISSKKENNTIYQDQTSTSSQVNTNSFYKLGDVSSHNSQSDCWTAVNGKVYNLTNYINSHPGGQMAIESICGVDGSSAFNNQHGGASKPERVLSGFLIGALK